MKKINCDKITELVETGDIFYANYRYPEAAPEYEVYLCLKKWLDNSSIYQVNIFKVVVLSSTFDKQYNMARRGCILKSVEFFAWDDFDFVFLSEKGKQIKSKVGKDGKTERKVK